MEKINFKIDIQINEYELDKEWLNQCNLAMKYGMYWAECQKRFTQAEENIKLIRSELIEEINGNWQELGYTKAPTGPVIESYYRNHKKHIKAKVEWVESQFELNVAEIAKKEISNTRKQALQDLVKLHGMNYFAEPQANSEESKEYINTYKDKKLNSKIGAKLKRTK